MNKQAHIHLKTTFKSTYVNQCIVTRNTYNSFRNDATYRLLIASVSSNYILHIVTETRCVISIKLTYPLLYFFSLIKTTNSKKYLPLPLPKFYLKFYGSCLARGFFFPPRLSCDNRFLVGITTSPFTLPSRNNPLNNSHRFTLIITWHRLSVCKQRESDNRHPMDRIKLEQCLYFKTFPLIVGCLASLAFLKAYSAGKSGLQNN